MNSTFRLHHLSVWARTWATTLLSGTVVLLSGTVALLSGIATPVAFAAVGSADLALTGLSTDQGLSQNSVFALAEDRHGFLWLGTEDGLNRWDGGSFQVYRAGPRDDPDVLHGRFVRTIVEDPQGFLWLATEGAGVARFDPRAETFRNFHHDPEDPSSLAEDLVLTLTLGRDGDLWIGTRSAGLSRLPAAARLGDASPSFEHFAPQPSDPCALSSGNINGLWSDDRGRLWVAGSDGLRRRRPEDGCFETIPLLTEDLRLTHLHGDAQGDLWVAGRGGLDRVEMASGRVKDHYLHDQVVTATLQDRDGSLWIGTESGGLVHLDPTDGTMFRRRSRAFDSESLVTDVIRSLHLDRAGTLWVGMEQGGAAYASRLRRAFGRRRSLRTADGLEQLRSVFALHVSPDGTVWIGTRDRGLYALDRNTGEARHWSHHDGSHDDGNRSDGTHRDGTHSDGRPDALDSRRISALTGDTDGTVLVGTVAGGVFRVDPGTGRVKRQPIPGDRAIRALLADGEGGLWVASWGNGLRHLRPNGTIDSFSHRPDDPHSLSDNVVICLEPVLADGRLVGLWVGTWSGGLVYLNTLDGRARAFRHDPTDPESLSSDQVADVHLDSRGRVWVATAGGLDRMQPVGGDTGDAGSRKQAPEAARFLKVAPFEGTVVFSLAEDSHGHLWAGSGRGLWHLNLNSRSNSSPLPPGTPSEPPVPAGLDEPSLPSARQFVARHGLQADELNVGAVAHGLNGELLFGGVSGFNFFDPHPSTAPDLFARGEPPPVVLTRLTTTRRSLTRGHLQDWVDSGRALELSPQERSFSVAFASPWFADVQHQRFAYRLGAGDGDGDAEWIDSGNQREARFARIPPGRHKLQVIAADGAGVWNSHGVTLDLYVLPTFWERSMVRAGGALLLFGLMAAAIQAGSQRRLRKLEREREEAIEVRRRLLAAREQERLRLARDLHDGPLQGLHALQLASSRGPQALGNLRQDLGELVTDLRSVCTRLRSPVLQLFGLEAAIRHQVDELRSAHAEVSWLLNLHLGGPEQGDRLGEEQRLGLFRVFREAVENALRHGEPASMTVELDVVDGPGCRAVHLRVIDDGCGFIVPARWIEPARRGHLGILGMDERMDALGGKLEVRSEPGKGTRLTAILPLDPATTSGQKTIPVKQIVPEQQIVPVKQTEMADTGHGGAR